MFVERKTNPFACYCYAESCAWVRLQFSLIMHFKMLEILFKHKKVTISYIAWELCVFRSTMWFSVPRHVFPRALCFCYEWLLLNNSLSDQRFSCILEARVFSTAFCIKFNPYIWYISTNKHWFLTSTIACSHMLISNNIKFKSQIWHIS